MGELKIGGFKSHKPTGQNYDFDLEEGDGIDLSDEGEKPTDDNQQVPPNEDMDLNSDDTDKPDDSEQKPSETQPNENADGKDPSSDSSLKPNEPDPVDPKEGVQINDESALKYLSEKLGKEVNSFDELLSQEQASDPLEEDPYMKELYEWRKKTGRPVEDWIKYQKDYDSLSDMDVAREFLQHEYPNFNEEEIKLELSKFQTTDDDFEGDSKMKNLELKKYATRGRNVLGEMKSELGEPSAQSLPKDVQESVELAKKIKEQYTTQQKQQEEYTSKIKEVASKTENFEIPLDDDLKLDFKISEENRKKLPEMINSMPHWKNEDGSWNHQAVINDAVKIFQFNDMVKLAYEQGINKGKDSLIAETSNSSLGETTSKNSKKQDNKSDVEIEGFDNLIGKGGMKVRF